MTCIAIPGSVKQRHGATHVLEAIIAAFLLLFFVLVMTQSQVHGGQDRTDVERSQQILHALDTADELRSPAYRGDLEQLQGRVQEHLPGHRIEVALLSLNSTTEQVSLSSEHSRTFAVAEDTEQQMLHIWYRNAVAPNISINGIPVSNNTGGIEGRQEAVDLSSYTAAGENTLHIDVADTSRIGYSIDIYDRTRSGDPPASADVYTTSHPVSGINTSFRPMEVTILSWQ